jgi:hypothetical protein
MLVLAGEGQEDMEPVGLEGQEGIGKRIFLHIDINNYISTWYTVGKKYLI